MSAIDELLGGTLGPACSSSLALVRWFCPWETSVVLGPSDEGDIVGLFHASPKALGSRERSTSSECAFTGNALQNSCTNNPEEATHLLDTFKWNNNEWNGTLCCQAQHTITLM